MTHTVDDLLRYARNEQAAMQAEPLDLVPLVAEVADEFRSPAATRSLEIDVADATDPAEVDGDRAALRQAVANLFDNAVRLAPEGSTITVGAGTDGPWAWVAVTDEGPGIDEADQPLVFRRFWRGPPGGRPAGERPRAGHRRPDPAGPRRGGTGGLGAGRGVGLLALAPATPGRRLSAFGWLSGPFRTVRLR